MAILNRYRTLAATLLVLLYAFVAMPVQWWHHHDAHAVSPEIFAEKLSGNFNSQGQEGKAIVKEKGSQPQEAKKGRHTSPAFTDDCPICSHQYASHDGIAFALTLSIPNTSAEFLAEHLIVLPFLPVAIFSNRGPPAMI